jgi:hypothetical protein
MADSNGGGIGVLGVLVGALVVILVGGGLLLATGYIGGGGSQSTAIIEAPKAPIGGRSTTGSGGTGSTTGSGATRSTGAGSPGSK